MFALITNMKYSAMSSESPAEQAHLPVSTRRVASNGSPNGLRPAQRLAKADPDFSVPESRRRITAHEPKFETVVRPPLEKAILALYAPKMQSVPIWNREKSGEVQ